MLILEVLLNAASMFSHGNARLPETMERVLRWCVVTPDMDRVHHSIARQETDSNFGFNLSWWDRLLGTYCPQPEVAHRGMTIGIDGVRELGELSSTSRRGKQHVHAGMSAWRRCRR
jgi:sterol desaturase/sphingolipid hydroxylase (fatty acid hydroxylase superfamily)